MNTYRYILEKYRGLSTRYTCPQCGRKHTFTRYIDTENNNNYLSERVGKCNRLDKCGYHYTPREYFTDNPHKRDNYLVEDGSLRPCGYHYTPREYFADNPHKRDKYLGEDGSLRPCGYHYTPKQYFADNPWLREDSVQCPVFPKHRVLERRDRDTQPSPRPICTLPEWVAR